MIGKRVHTLAAEADVPVLLRGGARVDLSTDPVVEKGDIVPLVAERLVAN